MLAHSMFAETIRKVSSEKRGAANATFWTAFDIGIASGSILWGLVVALCGYDVMFNLTAIRAFAALVVYFFKMPLSILNNTIGSKSRSNGPTNEGFNAAIHV